eukprot:CAMPEP_0206585010 /NCGR_PEP_ID=MMETSP0325_2-20121206/36136_1 /ASSEMBLY_ACC=CAM_ASM_000347 /TAXON_ID=2866 /ORGANISM="Crypthecodinium cohnii, Strain Seligo" /LENGTH=288 /DNA_ID=CAMNT_0054092423 /DNA_START=138 /DNA_END=1001 /DNA_ORIENTATION=-
MAQAIEEQEPIEELSIPPVAAASSSSSSPPRHHASLSREDGKEHDLVPRGPWGASWSPHFPTDPQIRREADLLIEDLLQAQAARKAKKPEASVSSVSVCGGSQSSAKAKAKQSAPKKEHKAATWHEWREMKESRPPPAPKRTGALGAPPPPPALEMPKWRPAARKFYEPAKVKNKDGTWKLRGVHTSSDVLRYSRIDPLTRKGWDHREVFKTSKIGEHTAASTKVWDALMQWRASEKPLPEWYAETTKATGFLPRTQSLPSAGVTALSLRGGSAKQASAHSSMSQTAV